MRALFGSPSRLVPFLPMALAAALAQAQVPGRNINMVSGTDWPGGDPFLQRQNEPSVAVSTRNPMHLLAGANDYRTVDLPGLPDDVVTGDAWLGVFTSYDGGATWKSTLLPGYRQEEVASGSPLFGLEAAADPTVRAGTNGLFYYSGIAFDRDNAVILAKAGRPPRPERTVLAGNAQGATSAVFVARFIDNNNKENGEPIAYISTKVLASDANVSGLFFDKPWLAVDMPRKGAGTCTITQTLGGKAVTQTFAAGNVYVAYSQFTKDASGQFLGSVYFSRSTNCGGTWSTPVKVSGTHHINQGATIAVDPRAGTVYVAWRRFGWPRPPATPQEGDAIILARSLDRGVSFFPPEVVAGFQPFDQGTDMFRFRTNAYPTVAVDRNGRVYVAFSSRGVQQPDGDARIVLTKARFPSRARVTFVDEDDAQETASAKDPKVTWPVPVPVDPDVSRRAHQVMPSTIVAGNRLQIAYVDLREDHTWGEYARDTQGRWLETRVPPDVSTAYGYSVFKDRIDDTDVYTRRHTADVWVAQAAVGDRPAFTVRRASSYKAGIRPDDGEKKIQQLQFNPPNLPLFRRGTASFWGDYIDIGALDLEQKNPKKWRRTVKTDASYVVFTDNRDVRPPRDGDWSNYTPPVSAALNPSGTYEPGTAPLPCDPTRPEQAGMRNQNVYMSRVTQGLFVGVPGNQKPLARIQRAFVVYAENATFGVKTFRLTIQNQPVGGSASFRQFLPLLTTIDVAIEPRSSISRTVFVSSSNPRASVNVNVQETSGGGVVPPSAGGLEGLAVINPDMVNPDMVNPDMVNPDMVNADILNEEVYTPDMVNPDMVNQEPLSPDMVNPDMVNPDMVNPDMVNPDMVNKAWSADVENPDMVNPDMVNPDMVNGSMEETASMTDTMWTITNTGNTTAAYDIRLLLKRTAQVPPSIETQLILHKLYLTPIAKDCQLVQETQNVLIASIPDPRFERMGDHLVYDPADSSVQHATLWLAPGESAKITLRVLDPDTTDGESFDARDSVTIGGLPHGTDTDDILGGKTEPEPVVVTPITFVRQPSVTAVGGFVPGPVEVLVQDNQGDPVAGATVTLELSSNPGDATLQGGAAVSGPTGHATFPSLRLDRLGTGYRLRATVGQVKSVASDPFDIVSLVVTSTADSGPGTLRAAIDIANTNLVSPDRIAFNIPGPGSLTITATSALPVITDAVTIDATTQPGYAGVPLVRLDGGGASGDGLTLQAAGSAVRGLAITRFSGSGIFIGNVSGCTIEGNYIGTDGTADLGNESGITVEQGGSHTLRNNVVSGNDGSGITLQRTHDNVVVGNRIGTNSAGTTALPNAGTGVSVGLASHNRIGGAAAGEGNVISGNGGPGVSMGMSSDLTIMGNRIGVDEDASDAIPNGDAGFSASDVNTVIIGGPTAGARNVISGNVGPGIRISLCSGGTVQGNFIGTNGAGTAPIPNGGDGVSLGVQSRVDIGGSAPGAGNVISGQAGDGLRLSDAVLSVIDGNFIGTDVTGTGPLPNAGAGVRLARGSSGNVIGGGVTAAGNTIAFNGDGGIIDAANPPTTNVFASNRIHSNTGLGIDLGDDGVTPNDSTDPDTGPNDLLNFPDITSVVANATTTVVSGMLNSVPGVTFTIQVFSSVACDPSLYGEGEVFEGWTTVTTGTGGTGNFSATIGKNLIGRYVTATTSTGLSAGGMTSEFSACRQVVP
jgi:parallel beta-helix repeat protein